MNTPAFSQLFPLSWRVRDSHPIVIAHSGGTHNSWQGGAGTQKGLTYEKGRTGWKNYSHLSSNQL